MITGTPEELAKLSPQTKKLARLVADQVYISCLYGFGQGYPEMYCLEDGAGIRIVCEEGSITIPPFDSRCQEDVKELAEKLAFLFSHNLYEKKRKGKKTLEDVEKGFSMIFNKDPE